MLLFSATWPERTARLAREACTDRLIVINVGSTRVAACIHINHMIRRVGDDPKFCDPKYCGASRRGRLWTLE